MDARFKWQTDRRTAVSRKGPAFASGLTRTLSRDLWFVQCKCVIIYCAARGEVCCAMTSEVLCWLSVFVTVLLQRVKCSYKTFRTDGQWCCDNAVARWQHHATRRRARFADVFQIYYHIYPRVRVDEQQRNATDINGHEWASIRFAVTRIPYA